MVGFVGEGGERESERERERKRETTGYEPLREAQRVIAGEGGSCSLPEVGGACERSWCAPAELAYLEVTNKP